MKIFIPTRGRADNQRTRKAMYFDRPHPFDVTYIVPNRELELWRPIKREEDKQGKTIWFNASGEKIVCVPDTMRSGDVRQWAMEQFAEEDNKQVHLDDDLLIARRMNEHSTTLVPATQGDILQLLKRVDEYLDTYVHGGISNRFGNNHYEGLTKEVGRAMMFHFFDSNVVMAEGIRWDRLPCRIDFDFTLSLLELGYPNLVDYEFTCDGLPSNSPGGSSEYRTLEMLSKNASDLKELHPDFVRVVPKYTKGAWGGDVVRDDVVIQWKKAFGSNADKRKLFREDN